MNRLLKVTFRFDADVEVRYLSEVPQQGQLVSHRAQLWVVMYVSADAAGVMVICEAPRGDGRNLQVA